MALFSFFDISLFLSFSDNFPCTSSNYFLSVYRSIILIVPRLPESLSPSPDKTETLPLHSRGFIFFCYTMLRLLTPYSFAASIWLIVPFRNCSTIFTFSSASILLFQNIKYPQVGFYILVSYLRVSYHSVKLRFFIIFLINVNFCSSRDIIINPLCICKT